MDEFADASGVSGKMPPRCYLWTDAFAVCNFLGLYRAVGDMAEMCRQVRWLTDDPLGVGGLLDDAARLSQLVTKYKVPHEELLHRLVVEAESSLHAFARSNLLRRSAEQRLPFRELGLSIGIHGLQGPSHWAAGDPKLIAVFDRLLLYQPLAGQIENFWSDPAHRLCTTWRDHPDINTVMLATSLAPEGYLSL